MQLQIFKYQDGKLNRIEKVEPGCWINIAPPFDQEELQRGSEELGIPFDFIADSLDIDERSRYEKDEDTDLIVINTPVKNKGYTSVEANFITVPVGIISTPDFIVTVCRYNNPVLGKLISGKRSINPEDQSEFALKIFELNNYYYLYYLKELNNLRNQFEKELYNSSRNKELANLLNIQKSLVYFITNLKANELMMMKMQRTDFLKIKDDEEKTDLFEDILIDTSQAVEMADVYTRILNGTMDAFASIISNNLNMVMKRLTAVTIILMVPTLVASYYGMNVDLPLDENPMAFALIFGASIFAAIILAWVFLKKRWF
jgi:magnesium transporter